MPKFILFCAIALFCSCSILHSQSHDGAVSCAFGLLSYRVYFPENFTDTACVIHVSRGGNGLGDDRGQLLSYVNHYVQNGYVVVQVDHRFAGSDVEQIAQYRGEEISCICEKVAFGMLDYGGFLGNVDPANQGFAGHSGGCMEGLEAAGTDMTHGDYLVPQIKAVFGMSPAGFLPDQFGIITNPPGFGGIENASVFVIIGEEEKDVNGGGTFMATDWRLQAYDAMNVMAPRFEAFVKGTGTTHNDIAGNNTAIKQFNFDNSLAFFNTYLKDMNQVAEIGTLSLPPDNPLVFSKKGLIFTSANDEAKTSLVRLYPNPSGSVLFLEKPEHAMIKVVRFFDTFGRLVLEKTKFSGGNFNTSNRYFYCSNLGRIGAGFMSKTYKKVIFIYFYNVFYHRERLDVRRGGVRWLCGLGFPPPCATMLCSQHFCPLSIYSLFNAIKDNFSIAFFSFKDRVTKISDASSIY